MICEKTKVGIGYRQEIHEDILSNYTEIDCVEIISENLIYNKIDIDVLYELMSKFHVILHGVSLSLASNEIDFNLLKKIKKICGVTKAPYYSEHLSVTRVNSLNIGHLSPILLTREWLDKISDNVNYVQDYLGTKLVLENITELFYFSVKDYDYSEFLHKLIDRTNCGILLDLCNLYINTQNHNWTLENFIETFPLNHIVHIHLAGGTKTFDNVLIDTHDRPIPEEVWNLLQILSPKIKIKTAILEHDKDFPDDFNFLLKQIKKIKKITTGSYTHSS